MSFYTESFKNGEELLTYFHKHPSKYGNFILEHLHCPYSAAAKKEVTIEQHHILPRHAGGTDASWNLISLTSTDHVLAHKFLYELEHNHYDYCVIAMRNGDTEKALSARSKQNVLINKKNKKGRFDPAIQSELGRRPKSPRIAYSHKNGSYEALARGTIWTNKVGKTVTFAPGECQSPMQIAERLSLFCDETIKKSISEKGAKSYFAQGIIKILVGYIDSKTNKVLYNVSGWHLDGILIDVPPIYPAI
jgi:hypothetical protein